MDISFNHKTKYNPGDFVWVARSAPVSREGENLEIAWQSRRYQISRIDIHFDKTFHNGISLEDERNNSHLNVLYFMHDAKNYSIALHDENRIHATKEECDVEARANAEKEKEYAR